MRGAPSSWTDNLMNEDIISLKKVIGSASSPTQTDSFTILLDSKLYAGKAEEFHGRVAHSHKFLSYKCTDTYAAGFAEVG